MTTDTPPVSNETAKAIVETLKKLTAGDFVSFNGVFDDQEVFQVEDRLGVLDIDFYDPRNWPSEMDHPVGALTITTEDHTGAYEAPRADIVSSNGYEPEYLGTITGATIEDRTTVENKPVTVAFLEWELNEEAIASPVDEEPEVPDPREAAHPNIIYRKKVLTSECRVPSGRHVDNFASPFFMLIANSDGTITIHPPGEETPVGEVDVSQLYSIERPDFVEQVESAIDEEVRKSHLKHPYFPFRPIE